LRQDWRTLAIQHNLDPELPHLHTTGTKPGLHNDYRTHYTKRLAKLVYRRYKKDVKCFGYHDAYRELLNFIEHR